TLRLHKLAGHIAENDPVLIRAEVGLRELRDEFDESVSLARVNGAQAAYLLVFEPSHALRFMVRVGDNIRSLHCTSAGKATLGSLPREEREAILKGLKLEPFTDRTITSLPDLRDDLARSIERGWYENREESVPGATTISA